MDDRPLIEACQAIPACESGEGVAMDLTLCRGAGVVLLGTDRGRLRCYLRMLAGLEQPLSGRVSVAVEKGQAGESLDFVDAAIPLLSILSGRENVRLPALYHGVGNSEAVEERVDWLLGLIDSGGDHDILPGYMSTLQQRHLALARGLILKPEVLIAVDPFSGLSRDERYQIIDFLQRQRDQGVAVVVSTDLPELAHRFASAIVFVAEGCCRYFSDWAALLASREPDVQAYMAYQRHCGELFLDMR